MNAIRQWILSVACVLLLLPPCSYAQTGSSTNLPTLTKAAQVLNLSRDEANKSYPVKIKGVITCWDVSTKVFFVQDDSAGVYFYPESLNEKVRFGDEVEITGISQAGRFSPIVLWSRSTVLGRGVLPQAKKVAIEELAMGKEDSQWIKLEGVVRKATPESGHFVFELASGISRLSVRVIDFPKDQAFLSVDDKISVQGVVCSTYNTKGQANGFNLIVQNPGMIQTLELAKPDPFQIPIVSTKDLLSYSRKDRAEHRAHLRGIVLLHHLGKELIIRDETGGIRVQSQSKIPLTPGDSVEVVGFPSPLGYTPVIEEGIYRKIGMFSLPTPISVTASQALSGAFDNELVTMEGKLLAKQITESGSKVLVMQAQDTIFHVEFDPLDSGRQYDSLQLRSRIQFTGVCQVDQAQGRNTFSILLPKGAALREIEPDPVARLTLLAWWTGGAAVLSLLAIVSASLMRRKIAERTETIRRREVALEDRYRDLFENANDIIYSHDFDGKITSINRAGEQLFGCGASEIVGSNLFDFVPPEQRSIVRAHVEQKLNGVPRTNYEMEFKTKQGNSIILEINSRLHFEEGKLIGVKGIARDITRRKETEAALRESEQQLKDSLEERERLGRNLHDGIIQSIYAVGLNLEDCRRAVHQDTDHVEQRLRTILGNLNDIIRDVRNFILGLESDVLKGQEFKTALKSLVITMGETNLSRFSMQVDSVAAANLSSAQATQLLHVAREAMSNSIRHSSAQRTILSLSRTDDVVRFEIQDDGVGFNPAVADGQGHGLRNMAARAANLGAAFRVISQVGEGTRIMLDIPRKKQHQNV